ncbi:unnamed protein product [Durusdinium trenchii]|uniref:Methyltransferase FkbM domain-containing protein n=1 Tax=Durusdinium trenchii TaxID=1381693 RepID=A0ABP0S9Y6_9DINO
MPAFFGRSLPWVGLLLSARPLRVAGRSCQGERWERLHGSLLEASRNEEFLRDFSPAMFELTQYEIFEWFKANYRDCVEGLLSMVLYLSLVMEERRASLLDLASRAARELNPLALRSGQSSWPFFGLLGQLQLVWQGGQHAAPLLTDPWRLPPGNCPKPLPPVLHPFRKGETLGNLGAAWGWSQGPSPVDDFANNSVLRLARNLKPGSLLIDAGVFDGTDWSLMGILAGATVLGFEPLAENRKLISDRLPVRLGEQRQHGRGEEAHTFLQIEPGESVPREDWTTIFRRTSRSSGHSYIMAAALGERVRSLNMTTRYDYSSISDQGYLTGPPNMEVEEIAMTTLDEIIYTYLPFDHVELLKLDVEGYEMGALRGAEGLLASGRIRFLVMEFHPGMLGSSGTDPEGLLHFLHHYCFRCFSLKIEQAQSFSHFVARYVTPEATPLQGLGQLEDLVCENLAFK